MTRSSTFSILVLVTGLLISSVAFAGKTKTSRKGATQTETNASNFQTNQETRGQALPAPVKEKEEKTTPPKIEELAHIHHFHKERVKKMKRHHKKFWLLSKLLLAICHLLILALAFIHLTH